MNHQQFENLLLSLGISFNDVNPDIKKLYMMRIEQNVQDKVEIVLNDKVGPDFFSKNNGSEEDQIQILRTQVPNLDDIVIEATKEIVGELSQLIQS